MYAWFCQVEIKVQSKMFENKYICGTRFALLYLSKLKENKGILSLNDKSSPEAIKFHLQMSKKSFKRAVGNLFKQKLIVLKTDSIELVENV